MATITLPTPLRPYADNQSEVEIAQGATVGELLQNLVGSHQDLKAHLFSDDGKIRGFVNVYLNDEDIRHLQGPDTPVSASDSLSIIPSIAGGAR